jgi:PleD family two-component response regulator
MAQVRTMVNKTLRILIADEHPDQRLQLERLLNGLGYYRIAPVESFEDLQRLVQCALQPFTCCWAISSWPAMRASTWSASAGSVHRSSTPCFTTPAS